MKIKFIRKITMYFKLYYLPKMMSEESHGALHRDVRVFKNKNKY